MAAANITDTTSLTRTRAFDDAKLLVQSLSQKDIKTQKLFDSLKLIDDLKKLAIELIRQVPVSFRKPPQRSNKRTYVDTILEPAFHRLQNVLSKMSKMSDDEIKPFLGKTVYFNPDTGTVYGLQYPGESVDFKLGAVDQDGNTYIRCECP